MPVVIPVCFTLHLQSHQAEAVVDFNIDRSLPVSTLTTRFTQVCDVGFSAVAGMICMYCWSTMAKGAQDVQRMGNPGRLQMVTAPCLAVSLPSRSWKKTLDLSMTHKSSTKLRIAIPLCPSKKAQKRPGSPQSSRIQMLVTLQSKMKPKVRIVEWHLSKLKQAQTLSISDRSRRLPKQFQEQERPAEIQDTRPKKQSLTKMQMLTMRLL